MTAVLQKLRAALPKDAAILLTTDIARRYVTGFEASLGYVFIMDDQAVALFDSRYIEAAGKAVYNGIRVELLKNLKEQGNQLLKKASCLYIETNNTVEQLLHFQQIFTVPVKAELWLDQIVAAERSCKRAEEVEAICKAQRFAEQAFEQILQFIRPGVTERQIAAELEYRMKLCGSDDMSFPTIAICGTKTSMPHGVPADSVVQKGDFVTMDFGATCQGYHSDMTRTVAVGFATDAMKKVYETVLSANLAAEKAVCAGVSCKTVDAAARRLIEQAGFGENFGHSTGHGVGLEIHEQPMVGPNYEKPLLAGQVITVEPGIYLPGKFGVRIEDMALVTNNGMKNLTNAKKSLIIL